MKAGYACVAAAGVASLGFLLAGCGGSSSGGGGSSTEAATTSSGSGSGSGAPTKAITISETEYKLTPSAVSVSKPGTYTFRVVNKGSITHALEIEGTGVEEKSGDVGPGESKTVTVDLKGGGTYEIYCPIDGHRQMGMEGKVTVGNAGAGSAGTTNDTSTTETETHTSTSGGGGYGGY
jgi:plastocyanin